jgi:putative hydrolase of the HAD superfamily
VLRTLRQRYCVVSVTNGNADVQRTPLRNHFDFSLSAAQVGAAKPDPEMFIRALKRSGLSADRAVHVGDDPERDVIPAKRLGMSAVWVNRTGASWPAPLAEPDLTVTDLKQLAAWFGIDG